MAPEHVKYAIRYLSDNWSRLWLICQYHPVLCAVQHDLIVIMKRGYGYLFVPYAWQ